MKFFVLGGLYLVALLFWYRYRPSANNTQAVNELTISSRLGGLFLILIPSIGLTKRFDADIRFSAVGLMFVSFYLVFGEINRLQDSSDGTEDSSDLAGQ